MKDEKRNATKKTVIEWSAIIGVVALLYVTGLHTHVIGTMQRALLATGLIKPGIPSLTEEFPPASMDFFFADETGRVVSLAEFEGSVIFLNVWATWCPPCIAEMPSIQSLHDEMKEVPNVAFILVSMDEEFDRAKQFMQRRNFSMPIYHYRSRSRETYESTVIPTTYVITKDGRLAMEKRGLAKYDTPEFKDFMITLSEL